MNIFFQWVFKVLEADPEMRSRVGGETRGGGGGKAGREFLNPNLALFDTCTCTAVFGLWFKIWKQYVTGVDGWGRSSCYS